MNQQNVELLSSEELENVTGGGTVVDVLKGVGNGLLETVGAPLFAWIPTAGFFGDYGRFDTDNAGTISNSITTALCSDMAAAAAGFGIYKAISSLCSKSGDKKENSEAAPSA